MATQTGSAENLRIVTFWKQLIYTSNKAKMKIFNKTEVNERQIEITKWARKT